MPDVPLSAQSIMDRLVEQVDQLSEDRIERNARIKTLREALEIALDALERTNRDDKFGYEDKKAVEDYVRRVLKETAIALDQERHDG